VRSNPGQPSQNYSHRLFSHLLLYIVLTILYCGYHWLIPEIRSPIVNDFSQSSVSVGLILDYMSQISYGSTSELRLKYGGRGRERQEERKRAEERGEKGGGEENEAMCCKDKEAAFCSLFFSEKKIVPTTNVNLKR
jgi:hypothetical protein